MTARAAISAIARLTWWRLAHGRGIWLAVAVAMLPIPFAIALRGHASYALRSFEIQQVVLVVLPAILIGMALAGELDDGSITYVWSRPLARWTLIAGKLVAVAPCAIGLVILSWLVTTWLGASGLPTLASIGALGAGALAATAIATALAVSSPRYGTVLALVYMLCDGVIGQIPAQLQRLSIAHDVSELAGLRGSSPLIGALSLAAILAIAIAIAIRRIGTHEA